MRIITDIYKLNFFIKKYNLEKIFDSSLISYGKLINFSKGEFILESGNTLDNYYILVEGQAKIIYPFENGKDMTLKLYKDFKSIGEIELLDNSPILCDVISSTDTYLIQIPLNIMKNVYLKSPNFLLYISNILAKKLHATIKNVSYSYVYPFANRLATYLLSNITNNNLIKLKDSYKNIAQNLGTSYRHLNRTLNYFEKNKLISIDKKNIIVLNIDKLKEMSKNQYIDSY